MSVIPRPSCRLRWICGGPLGDGEAKNRTRVRWLDLAETGMANFTPASQQADVSIEDRAARHVRLNESSVTPLPQAFQSLRAEHLKGCTIKRLVADDIP